MRKYSYHIVAKILKPKGKKEYLRTDDMLIDAISAKSAIDILQQHCDRRGWKLREVLWIRAQRCEFDYTDSYVYVYPETQDLPVPIDGFGSYDELQKISSFYNT